jgi:double zinc ribbon protein/Sel1 repeat-containing protein
MQCAFCGTENRPEYKFCGMCGVRLDRRLAERRVSQRGTGVKCDSCGHSNEPGLKFCGMCGTRVERRVQERRGNGNDAARAGAIANAQLPRPEVAAQAKGARRAATATVDLPEPGARRRGDPAIFRNEPGHGSQISGPSFLGLNSQSEGNGEYLLEDEPSRGGLRRLLLLVILAAILGLAFVQWRSSFKANPKPAPVKTEPSPSPQPQGGNQAPQANPDQPAKDASSPESAKTGEDAKAQAENPIAAVVPTAAAAAPAESASDSADKTAAETESSRADAETKTPEEAHLPDHKPSAALVRAQQYLRGRGVPQNCEQGLLYLRAATEKNDPGAAIQMAALYSSGHCVKQDRVMAYRWFNSAHELEPANSWIQRNMDQLWAQMTSQERRLAGY